ncbi:hypothetical protein GCM10009007_02680 [Formosimonas limnophila]|uniref:SD-repeat containing protein B domain-containing protein n=1 Tax=Formosimonas limnophila TaxID=1384487 RepID=A0A8J3FZ53_9BURK|nr:SdrD B-like domain-containing protein [Formosimonas limnophila]GHA65534.1 hypothetical protein GCM10009007_02680 [Formosimonas limnophila]
MKLFKFLLFAFISCVYSTQGLAQNTPTPTLIGAVFEDENKNGLREKDEQGIPGVRIMIQGGFIVETDADGLFHVDGLPRARNIVIKLDKQTLPIGYQLTTQNPRSVYRSSSMANINFGAAKE